MSEQIDLEREADGGADAVAALAVIALVVFTVCYWLAAMPS